MAHNKVVLYLDDNPAYLQLMRFIINCQAGVRVLLSGSVNEALRQIYSVSPDIVFINLQLESSQYQKFVAALKEDAYRHIPLIGLTDEELTPEQKQAYGLDDYVERKLNVEAILAILEKYPGRNTVEG